MQAGEVGVQIQIYPTTTPTPGFLTGATCTLSVRSPIEILSTLTLTISNDGSYAYRNTLATDFPIAGDYNLQLVAVFTSPVQTLISPIQVLNVGYTLGS